MYLKRILIIINVKNSTTKVVISNPAQAMYTWYNIMW
jgi:hypothetical protein